MLVASAEALANCIAIRVHPQGKGFGDEFEWGCVVVQSGSVGEIKMALRAPSRAEIRALAKCLRSFGITEVYWMRVAEDGLRSTRVFSGRGL